MESAVERLKEHLLKLLAEGVKIVLSKLPLAVFTDILNGILGSIGLPGALCRTPSASEIEGWLKIELAAALLSKG